MFEIKPFTEDDIKAFVIMTVWKYVGLEGYTSNEWARFIMTWVHERALRLFTGSLGSGKTYEDRVNDVLDQIGWPKQYRGKFEI